MRILVVTDGHPKNPGGINTTISNTARALEKLGHQLFAFTAENGTIKKIRLTDKMPFYPYIPIGSKKLFLKFLEKVSPDAIHIYTERPIGKMVRNYCASYNIPFTTSFVTNYEASLEIRMRYFPKYLIWKYLRWFHKPSAKIHVTTPRLKNLLHSKGFQQEIAQYSRGIDFNKFYYDKNAKSFSGLPRPYFMTMSRISPEKNIEAFLELDLPGTKFVIGEGHSKKKLMKRWDKEAIFLPYENVAEFLSQGDVFVCPSKFETFGLVMIEAMACGLPVAAFPVMGPKDIIQQGVTGYMNSDLKQAALDCLLLNKENCIQAVQKYSWETHAKNLVKHVALIRI